MNEPDKPIDVLKWLLNMQAVTVSKSGESVTISCESVEDAEMLFEWITSLVEVRTISGSSGSGDPAETRIFGDGLMPG